jgi:hypothetical protein
MRHVYSIGAVVRGIWRSRIREVRIGRRCRLRLGVGHLVVGARALTVAIVSHEGGRYSAGFFFQ